MNEVMSPEKAISRGAVAIYKNYIGRGPEPAATLLTDESSSTTCRNSMTKAERTLVERGEGEMVRAMRRKFQDTMRDEYVAMVEDVTKREGESFLSDHDPERDVAIEVVTFR